MIKFPNFILFTLILCLYTFSCSSKKPIDIEYEYKQAYLRSKLFEEKFGVTQSPFETEYIDYIVGRLLNHEEISSLKINYKIKLLNTERKIALSPGLGIVLLSKGLVKNLPNEASFAFIAAHEMAHGFLGHTSSLGTELANNVKFRKKIELEADEWAAGVVALAGYDPRISVETLALSHSGKKSENDKFYPNFPTRLSLINKQIIDSGWMPPGTINRRAFRLFQDRL